MNVSNIIIEINLLKSFEFILIYNYVFNVMQRINSKSYKNYFGFIYDNRFSEWYKVYWTQE